MDTHDARDAMTKISGIVSYSEDAPLLRFQRADGGLVLGAVAPIGIDKAEHLTPERSLPRFFRAFSDRSILEAIIVNTGGGLVEGDRLSTTITVGMGARLNVTTQAAD